MAGAAAGSESVSAFNIAIWRTGDYVGAYTGRAITPPEAILVARHRDVLGGTVLELGCGAGRITAVLAALSDRVHAIDVSEGMVAACRQHVPGAAVGLGDLLDLSAYADGWADAVVAVASVLDVLGDAERRATLAEVRRILRPDGLLLFSGHNRAYVPQVRDPFGMLHPGRSVTSRSLARAGWRATRLPRSLANRRRAKTHVRSEPGYAIVNDEAHDHRLAHYYITREAQEHQLADAGFTLTSCLTDDGRVVASGEEAPESGALTYAAFRR